MKLKLVRTDFTDKTTISKLYVNDVFECWVLEDVCREDVPGTWKKELKVPGKTAIPYGTYEVVITFSNRFKILLPLLLAVPDFEGIRIHPGNKAEDTEGCLLPGVICSKDEVLQSRAAFGPLFRKLEAAALREKIYIEVTKENHGT